MWKQTRSAALPSSTSQLLALTLSPPRAKPIDQLLLKYHSTPLAPWVSLESSSPAVLKNTSARGAMASVSRDSDPCLRQATRMLALEHFLVGLPSESMYCSP